MLYWLLYEKLFPFFHPFRIFRYLTFRTAFASGTALLIALFIGPYVIQKLREFQIGQFIRNDGPQTHLKKSGTPTMGGVLIAIAILLPTVLWSDPANPFVWIVVFATMAFGAIGFADDYIKLVRKRSLGLTARAKLLWQGLAGATVALALVLLQHHQSNGYQGSGQPLPQQLGAHRHAQVAPLDHLYVVVGKADGPKGEGRKDRDPDKRIGGGGPQHRGQQNGNADQHAAHGWSARLLQVRLRSVLAHKLANLQLAQLLNHVRPDEQRDHQRRERSERGAKRQIAEYPERVKERKQLFVEQPVKQRASHPGMRRVLARFYRPRSATPVEAHSTAFMQAAHKGLPWNIRHGSMFHGTRLWER